MEAHLAKYKKLVPVLALIFEMSWGAYHEQEPSSIGVDALHIAIKWAEYLESHAAKIYNCSISRLTDSSKSLLKRIRSGQVKEPFTARDIYHGKHWSGLSSPEEVQEVLDYLSERNYLMQQRVMTGGRTMMKYWVHPDIFK